MALVSRIFYSKQIFAMAVMSLPMSQIVVKQKNHTPVFVMMWMETQI